VFERYPYVEAAARVEWDIDEFDDGRWGIYGSLYVALEFDDGDEEQALRRARRRLREADPKLLKRVDFDPEGSGTGISAAAREDLEAVRRILALG